jgi:RNA-binding protein
MITSKQRSQLKAIAQNLETIIQIGKGGITDPVVSSVDDALTAREIVKGKVLESAMLTPREACEILAERCKAEPVQVIGTKFVLFRRNPKNPIIVFKKEKK